MSSSRYRRLATVATTALLGALLLGTGTAVAATPGWQFTVHQVLSPVVSPGADAGYHLVIKNTGKSNIAQLFLLNDSTQPIDYFVSSRAGCDLSPSLKCTYGALNPGDSIDVTVAYRTPSSSGNYTTTFYLNGTGNTGSDGGTSHGDSLLQPMTVNLNANPNFGGGWQVHPGTIGNNQGVGRSNIQGSSVTSGLTLLPVTIQDGLTFGDAGGGGTDPCGAMSCIGDWTKIEVGDGSVGPIEVKFVIYGKSIKGTPSLSSFGLWHNGAIISTPCGPTTLPSTGGAECLTVTKDGNGNYQLDAWLNSNGTGRGVLLG